MERSGCLYHQILCIGRRQRTSLRVGKREVGGRGGCMQFQGWISRLALRKGLFPGVRSADLDDRDLNSSFGYAVVPIWPFATPS